MWRSVGKKDAENHGDLKLAKSSAKCGMFVGVSKSPIKGTENHCCGVCSGKVDVLATSQAPTPTTQSHSPDPSARAHLHCSFLREVQAQWASSRPDSVPHRREHAWAMWNPQSPYYWQLRSWRGKMAGPKRGGWRPLWQTAWCLEQTCKHGQGALDPHLEVFHRIAGHRSAGKHPSGGIPLESSSRQMADARRLRFYVRVLCHLLITPKGLWDTRAWSNLTWWSGREPRIVEG